MRTVDQLPPRVRAAIHEQSETSELLLGWAQFTVVTTFAALYAVSPRPGTIAESFEPVPYVLTVYFAFTVLRLVLAHLRRLPRWFLYLSVIADMALLMLLIWSFHLQYRQPPSFYLKAPTLLYVFIFIALRALYFEFQFVAMAGVAAALGWLALVIYVVVAEPGNPMVTRDYVEYMTSNSVLLGAEFDKIISILMVTGILVIAIVRSRRLLLRSVMESIAAEELKRFVPDAVARQAAAADHLEVGGGEVREATIFFSDIEDFTGLSETLDPTALISVLNEYFALVTDPIERHGGVINQYQGDAILASFNLPNALSDHALHAVQAALEIQRLLASHRFSGDVMIGSRIGINTGVVIGGLVGNNRRLGYTLHGDEVNLAARLEQLNKDLGTRIVVSERTRELAGAVGARFVDRGETRVRGRQAPVRIFAVVAHEGGPASAP
jgi:adenylate cyclase